MEISGKKPVLHLDAYAKQIHFKPTTSNFSVKESIDPVAEDQVVLSSEAGMLRDAMNRMNSIPDIREEKVAHLKEQIDSGGYEIRENELAGKLIRESLFNALI